MNKKTFTIKKTEFAGLDYESIEFQAINIEGETIFGANAEIIRSKNIVTGKWEEWKINYGTSGSKNYANALPFIAVINKAMDYLEELQK